METPLEIPLFIITICYKIIEKADTFKNFVPRCIFCNGYDSASSFNIKAARHRQCALEHSILHVRLSYARYREFSESMRGVITMGKADL